ncbi:hypothetical protein XIS1_1260014 [Xenorhabdus innexi]|uniref:Uncharacterized protein n=1 Tax=Xenorhabdus innexi TaxID=290109 RepID=A0A1N6MSE0_9GAMM|nr:hypothetical protein XIS1_1260014 [Xenorhabdus innexi]
MLFNSLVNNPIVNNFSMNEYYLIRAKCLLHLKSWYFKS